MSPRPTTLSGTAVDKLLLMAWSRLGSSAFDDEVRRIFGSRAAARRALTAWPSRPLEPGTPLPDSLPGGICWPAASTPWPRVDSPIPGVDLPPVEVGRLAWAVVASRNGVSASAARAHTRAHGSQLAEVARPWLDSATAAALIEDWFDRGAARRCAELCPDAGPQVAPTSSSAARRESAAGHPLAGRRAPAAVGGRPAPSEPTVPLHKRDTSPAERVRRALHDLLIERPLHWTILGRAKIRETTEVDTMAVGLTSRGQLYLFYSPTFVLTLTHEHCKGVLLHEVNHVLFGHLSGRPDEAERHRRAWEYACECTANEYVPYELPGEPITIESLDLPPGESTEDRFRRLVGRGGLPALGLVADLIDGALVPLPSGPSDTLAAVPAYPENLVVGAADALESLDTETAGGLRAHSGVVPSQVLGLSDDGISRLDWRSLLQRLVGGILRQQTTYRWPSRRRPSLLGVVPGRRRRRERPAVLAAIDTSGSMSASALKAVAAELQELSAQRIRVAVVQCDASIQNHRWFGPTDSLRRILGRGGTDLRPPFSRAIRARYEPDLIVYFTDGHGPAPAEAPRGVDVLWVLTGTGPKRPAPWGRAVVLS